MLGTAEGQEVALHRLLFGGLRLLSSDERGAGAEVGAVLWTLTLGQQRRGYP